MAKSVSMPRERGFTLIEMSIVLVIIGLIIGGILKGQELIESSRIKNVISQVDTVRAGINTFQDRFRSLPGDYGAAVARINANLVDGDEDGIISTATAATAPTTLAGLAGVNKATDEEMQFWNHLMGANLLGGGAVTNATTAPGFSGATTGASPMPQSAYPQTGLSLVYGTHPGSTVTGDSRRTHWIVLSKFGTTAIQTTTTGATSAQRAFQMDNKYDDGLPMGGTIRTLGLNGNCGNAGTDTYANTTGTECEIAFTLQ